MNPGGRSVQQQMSAAERAAWWTAIIFLCGLPYPFYRHRRNKLARTVKYYP